MTFKKSFFLSSYFKLGQLAYPLTFFSPRLKEGWQERTLQRLPKPTDILIQAASVGESKLALLVAKRLINHYPNLKITVSTNTKQGKEILEQEKSLLQQIVYFPLDTLNWQKKFISALSPKLVLILETEIWPAFFYLLKQKNIPLAIVNARMRTQTFSQYLFIRKTLENLCPNLILAISSQDKKRFATIFPKSIVKTMPNLKFELIDLKKPLDYVKNPLSKYIGPQKKFLVFGSIRKEEEEDIFWVIKEYLDKHPQAIIGLFPRHMQRVSFWQKKLSNFKIVLRSKLKEKVKPGTIIIWDKVGELAYAYGLAKKVFVGGSLKPLGGQNFLEPLAQGVIPLVGPYLENFAWVGRDFFQANLVVQVQNKQELLINLLTPYKENKDYIFPKVQKIIDSKKGGLNLVLKELTPLLRFYSS